jgi:hypothetical protein
MKDAGSSAIFPLMPRIPTPLRLTVEDFDAFLPALAAVGSARSDGAAGRARGGRTGPATRARLDLAARMLRWARSVVRRLEDQGIDVKVVAPGFGAGPRRGKGSEGQRVLIQSSASPTAREGEPGGPLDSEIGARWVLHLDEKGVDVALELPASAVSALDGLRQALGDDERRSELSGIVETLPEQFTFGLVGDAGVAAQDLSGWGAVLERGLATGRSVRLGWSVPREVAVAHSGVLDEQLEDAIVLLAPVYQLLAQVTDAERQGRGGSDRRKLARARLGSKGARPILRTTRRREREVERATSPAFERGTRVRVLAGPFAGKVGIVKELDGKGRAQVMLGLLATRIDLSDLSASGGGRRPTLSSSHRKPLALR